MDLLTVRMIFRALAHSVPDLSSIGCLIQDLGFPLGIFVFMTYLLD